MAKFIWYFLHGWKYLNRVSSSDITYRKIQNGQDGKFYDEDLKVAFYKLQSEYYYHLSKEIEFEVESEYFQKTNNERKGDVKQHAKNL